MISKALYGLRSSGARWHDNFANTMRKLNFFANQSQPSGCARVIKSMNMLVDDLAIAMKDPKDFISIIESKYKFKPDEGRGPLSFHLGMKLNRVDDVTLYITSLKYIGR